MQALVSVSMFYKQSSCHQLVSRLSCFYPYCSISYFGLMTGSDVDKMTNIVTGGILTFLYYIDHLSCSSLLVFSFVYYYYYYIFLFDKMHRRWRWLYELFILCQTWCITFRFMLLNTDLIILLEVLLILFVWNAFNFIEAVIWGNVLDGVAQAVNEDLTAVKDELRSNQTERWQAVGMLKHIYSFVNLPWELKKHAIDFLLCITDENISQKCDEHIDFSSYMPSLFAALQVVVCQI